MPLPIAHFGFGDSARFFLGPLPPALRAIWPLARKLGALICSQKARGPCGRAIPHLAESFPGRAS